MSLKNTILQYLKAEYPRTVHKGEIGRKAVLEWGYENENAGRRCRELKNENLIAVDYDEKGAAMYRYIDREEETRPTWDDLKKQEEEEKKRKFNQASLGAF